MGSENRNEFIRKLLFNGEFKGFQHRNHRNHRTNKQKIDMSRRLKIRKLREKELLNEYMTN